MEENRSTSIFKVIRMRRLASSGTLTTSPSFDTNRPDAKFEVISTVPVQLELLNEIEKQAAKRGVKVETLVNQWLQQKLYEEAA